MKKAFVKFFGFISTLDIFLILICLTASMISTLTLYSFYHTGVVNSLRMVGVQAISAIIGVIIACIIAYFDYDVIAKLWKIHLPITAGLVILTFFIGVQPTEADDKAWLDLGITTFQPSELLKLSFIFTFALHLQNVGKDINRPKQFVLLCLHAMAYTLLIMLQGDFGSALVFFAIFIFMMFVAGLSWRFVLTMLTSFIIVAPLIWFYVLPDYLQRRFLIAWTPELDKLGDGLQQFKGKVALGSGKLYGRGLFSSNLFSVPEAYNDFIFSYIGQTMGFIGCAAVLLIISIICIKILITARSSKDKLGMFICVGVFALFLFQSVINIGMVVCVTPVIGITLPFFSSGGTSLVSSFIAIGMVISVYRKSKKDMLFD